jgi:hypothetical protein
VTVHRGQSPVESPPFFEALAGGEDDEGEDEDEQTDDEDEDEQTDDDRIDEAVDAATDTDVAVDVPAGATETVDIDLSETAFARYDEQAEWTTDEGTYEIEVGRSSRDVRSRAEPER